MKNIYSPEAKNPQIPKFGSYFSVAKCWNFLHASISWIHIISISQKTCSLKENKVEPRSAE